MKRLTQKDEQGNWCLKGLAWAQLYVGQMITEEVNEKLYGALWKLMEYEGTGLTPDEIMDGKMLTGWIPAEERQPRKNEPVLVFAQSTTIRSGEIMMVGACNNRYWFIQSGKDTLGYPCNDFRVIAWMPLPEPYRPEA